MQVFVYEHLCATTGLPSSLRAEGAAMLTAVLDDLASCPHVRPVTLVAEGTFRALARASEWALVIAPECEDILEQCCRRVEEEGGRLLGPSSSAVRLTADKLTLARCLRDRDVPTPPAATLEVGARSPFPFPLVCKPRHGAGSQATFLVPDHVAFVACPARAHADGWRDEMIVQPYVPGRPASVAFLAGPAGRMALPAVQQDLSADGRFRYHGGRLPLPPALDGRARRVAERAADAVPGLSGYFGIDLVLGEAADGSADVVIEINPRLTTSYVGLRRLAECNLMEALLAVAAGERLPALTWRSGPVRFQADGSAVAENTP